MQEMDATQLAPPINGRPRPGSEDRAADRRSWKRSSTSRTSRLSAQQIAAALGAADRQGQAAAGSNWSRNTRKPEHGLSIREVAGGYKMATKAEHHEAVRAFVKKLTPPLKLSLPALETLAVIAYKQPVTAPEIMDIRGVQGAGVLKTLLDRKLIAEAGRKRRGRQADPVQDHQGVPGPVRAEGFERAADAEGIRRAGTAGAGGRIAADEPADRKRSSARNLRAPEAPPAENA